MNCVRFVVKNLLCRKSAQISVRDALFVTVPYQLHRFVRKHTKWQDMTRGEAIKDFFYKTILPVAAAALLYCIFRSACLKNGELDYLWLWILCGLPFGIWRLRLWIIPGGGSLGSGIALFALNFILAGIIGGFVLVWRLIVAAWYVPLTVWKLISI